MNGSYLRSRSLKRQRNSSAPSLSVLAGQDLWPEAQGCGEVEDELQLVALSAPSGSRSVEVVFHIPEGPRVFLLDSVEAMMWMSDTHQAVVRWLLPFANTGLPMGIYSFSFLVDGVRTLSLEHPVYGDTNFGLFHQRTHRYICMCNRKDSIDLLERPSLVFERVASCEPQIEDVHRMPRSHSTSNLASAVADEDVDMSEAPTNTAMSLPDQVFASLLGRTLGLRLLGHALPEARHPAEVAGALRFEAGAHQITKPLAPVCEDACFFAPRALGVADGVGGMVRFQSYGVDSAKYAAGLMQTARRVLCLHEQGCPGSPQAAEELALAAVSAADEEAVVFGGATITVMALQGVVIGVANLGDSGFMLLRQGKQGMFVVKRSEEMQHGWNFPYQLTHFPPELAERFSQLQVDRAKNSDLYTCDVRVGDLILLFSDGLTDNVYEKEVLEIASCALSPAVASLLGLHGHATPPENIAKALADAAHLRSQDERANVPFSDYSWRFGYDCPGGKEDDITVVAAWVVPDEPY